VQLATLVQALEERVAGAEPRLVDPRGAGTADTGVTGVRSDSRQVVRGDLFACLRGDHTDGHHHAAAAVAAGAAALLVEEPLEVEIPQVVVTDTRRALGPLASRLHGDPSRHLAVVGVTGTNGKTTVVHLLSAVLEAQGLRCSVIGTLTGPRTTPEAPELQERLAREREAGTAVVAMEVSSHALAMHRVDGTLFEVAGFTNLSRDHLDYHGDLEAYFSAKARLFTPELSRRGVVNADDAHGRRLLTSAPIPCTPVHPSRLEGVQLGWGHSTFRWRDVTVRCPLPGRINVANALLAAESAVALGAGVEAVVAGLGAIPAVPGRFEVVDRGQPFAVVVDYAHTPDGIERLLSSVRELTNGAVWIVFGCGGDRDVGKRPQMGESASRLADRVIVTDDNPRSEDPGAIARDILAGVGRPEVVRVVHDRRDAIALALGEARDHDAVVIAGKGHETEQIVGAQVRPFLDAHVAADVLGDLGYEGRGALR
jgi:UDP-N-acetylmuramoyl-L-alanyl-D-glutamate--2,6-diaminopimelate ligase